MFLSILKFISIVFSGILGMYASVTNFRNELGKVTRSGRLTFMGVLVSAVLAGVLQIYSDSLEDEQNQKLLHKIDNTLVEVQRGLYPLDNLNVEFAIEPDWNQIEFRDCYQEIGIIPDITVYGSLQDFEKCSTLYNLLSFTRLNLIFYKDYSNPSNILTNFNLEDQADLIIKVQENDPDNFDEGEFLNTDLVIDSLSTRYAKSIPIDSQNPNIWIGANRYNSALDLLDSHLFIELDLDYVQIGEDEIEFKKILDEFKRLLMYLKLVQLNLNIENGVSINLNTKDLKFLGQRNNNLVYHFQFPSELVDLRNVNSGQLTPF